MGKSPRRHYLVVGVDFGTTYTGINYSWSHDDDILGITEWPAVGLRTEHAPKAPTQIAYVPDSTGLSGNCWGYQIQSGTIRCAGMKLLMDRNVQSSENDDPGLKADIDCGVLAMPGGRDVRDVTADFFKELYNFTLKNLKKDYPSKVIDLTPIKYWFTMPAIWSDEAQIKTLEAAKRGGFASRKGDEVCMIPEPEAAALATLGSSDDAAYGDEIEAGEGVLICDCGGGTVDLTAYKIIKEDPLELEECCVGTGGKCGGTYIDRNIHKLLSDRFGSAFDTLGQNQIGQGSKLMEDFDWNKRIFGNENATLKDLRLFLRSTPDSAHYDSTEGGIILTDDDMKKVFDPVVGRIISLIEQQVKAASKQDRTAIKMIMLVGGFGDSPYLRKELRHWCDKHRLRMTGPQNSWGAVVKGAVIRGLELAHVVRKKCRRHYGIRVSMPFRQGIDEESSSFICPATRTKRAPDYMSWSIHKVNADLFPIYGIENTKERDQGEDIVDSSVTPIDLYHALDENAREMTVILFSCNHDDAPEKHKADAGLEQIGTIVTDLKTVDLTRFDWTGEAGSRVCKFDFQLEVVLGHKHGTISFRVRALGEIIGQTSVEFVK